MSLHATLSIDVMKIDKPALFKGKKGTYLGLVLMDNKNGNVSLNQDVMHQ
jgi:hypothetical protein